MRAIEEQTKWSEDLLSNSGPNLSSTCRIAGRRTATLEDLMASDYLLKTEPSEYSFADLQRDAVTVWDGVHNPVALRNLGQMEPGSRLVIYETGDNKSAVGTATVVSVDVSNPKSPAVEIKAAKALAKPISLAQIKANSLFADSPLVRQGRLSVVPLTKAQYKFLTGS
jgi:predicted RNA-binding protein with PUA-like domain